VGCKVVVVVGTNDVVLLEVVGCTVVVVVGTIDVVLLDVVGCTVVVVVGSTVVVVVVSSTVVVVIGAAVIVNAALQVTISVSVVAVTSRSPNVAPGSMVIFATASVAEFTCVLLTVMPVPLKDAKVTSLVKLEFEPVIVTSRVAP